MSKRKFIKVDITTGRSPYSDILKELMSKYGFKTIKSLSDKLEISDTYLGDVLIGYLKIGDKLRNKINEYYPEFNLNDKLGNINDLDLVSKSIINDSSIIISRTFSLISKISLDNIGLSFQEFIKNINAIYEIVKVYDSNDKFKRIEEKISILRSHYILGVSNDELKVGYVDFLLWLRGKYPEFITWTTDDLLKAIYKISKL